VKRKIAIIICLVALMLIPVPAKAEQPKNVLIIGWDGAGRYELNKFMEECPYPTSIERLAEEGALVAIDVLGNTETKPGWATVLTGYRSSKHRVRTNEDWLPIPKGYTILERLESIYGDEIFTAFLVGKGGNMNARRGWVEPLGDKFTEILESPPDEGRKLWRRLEKGSIVKDNDNWYHRVPNMPYFFTKKGIDYYKCNITGGDDDKITDVVLDALELLREHADEHFAMFIHFDAPDHHGHQYGEDSVEYYRDLKALDYALGDILEELWDLGVLDNTLVYVTADHGFDIGKHAHLDAPFVWLATNDKSVMRRGYQVDIAPTIYESLGIDWRDFEPPLDGNPLNEPYNPPIWDAAEGERM